MDGWTDADTSRVARATAARGGRGQVVLDAVEHEDAVAQRLAGHNANDLDGLGKTPQLVITEEKSLVLPDRPAEGESTAVIVIRSFGDLVGVVVPGIRV